MPIKKYHQQLFSPSNNQNLIFLFLALIAVGLSLSSILMSIGSIGLGCYWFLSANFKQKFAILKTQKIIWPLLLLFALHIVWLLNTSDYKYALHDIKIKLPLLAIPLVLGTSEAFSVKRINYLLMLFIGGVFASSIVSLTIYLGFTRIPVTNIRDISIFISHIRLGLMVVFTIVVLFYFYFQERSKWSFIKKFLLLAGIVWFMVFNFILQSTTSWVVLVILAYYLFLRYQNQIASKIIKWSIILVLAVLPILFFVFGARVYHDFYQMKDDVTHLPKKTLSGNVYFHDTVSHLIENGHFVNTNISIAEMKETWPKLSKIPFYSPDAKGQPIYGTIIRYCASKGLTKDREGLLALSKEDIHLIEMGYASCLYLEKNILYLKIYEAIWEFDRYYNHDDPNGKSICMRIEYLKTSSTIIKENLLLGVGTGDLQKAFSETYQKGKTKLIKIYQKRAHNQYVTFFVAFGIFGFVMAMWGLFGPLYYKKDKSILLICFSIIIFLSMINEDTLETQAGVTFFTFFYTILLLYQNTTRDA